MRRLAALCFLAACAEDPATVEDAVHIDHGFYGRLTIGSDAGRAPPAGPDASDQVSLYRVTPSGPELLLATTTDANGVFELEVTAGSYELCVRGLSPDSIYSQWEMNCAGPCTFITASAGLVRADWESSAIGGFWTAGDYCPRR